MVLDVRDDQAYQKGHVPAAYGFPWSPDFPQQLSRALRGSRPPLGIFGDRDTAAEAQKALAGLGLSPQCVWDAGLHDWIAQGLPVVGEVTAHDLYRQREQFVVLDIREPYEHRSGVVPGAVLVPMGQLPHKLSSLNRDHHYAVMCRSGNRSLSMSAWLALQGYRVTNVLDGINGWLAGGYPLVRPEEG